MPLAAPRRRALMLPAVAAALAGPPPGAASAREPEVDLLLALAVDASGSIDTDEFRLQREGYAEALADPAVLAASSSKPRRAITVARVEWG